MTLEPAPELVLYTARGDTVHINENEWRIKTSAGETLETVTRAAGACRRLTGFFSSLQTSGSFTMMMAGGF